MTRLQFDPEWRITAFTVVLVPVMIGLGFWQLDRAGEKAQLAAAFERKQAQDPVFLELLDRDDAAALAYLPVRLEGRFREDAVFLLDNRLRQGRFGYEVIAVMDPSAGGDPVLVNRGWLPGDPARLSLPEVPPVTGDLSLRGQVYVPPGEPYLLGEQVVEPGWPKRVQALDAPLLAQALGEQRLFPYSVRLDEGQPGALVTDWQVINVSPEKHTGYAVQWFTMATVLAVFYLLRCSNIWQLLRGRSEEDQT